MTITSVDPTELSAKELQTVVRAIVSELNQFRQDLHFSMLSANDCDENQTIIAVYTGQVLDYISEQIAERLCEKNERNEPAIFGPLLLESDIEDGATRITGELQMSYGDDVVGELEAAGTLDFILEGFVSSLGTALNPHQARLHWWKAIRLIMNLQSLTDQEVSEVVAETEMQAWIITHFVRSTELTNQIALLQARRLDLDVIHNSQIYRNLTSALAHYRTTLRRYWPEVRLSA